MVTKGIIEEIVTPHTARVRIPFFNRVDSSSLATPVKDLAIAGICTLPGSLTNYQVGDIVIIAYDEGYADRPIILGQLSRDIRPVQSPDVKAADLEVNIEAHLPANTYIGDVTPNEIKQLLGINENLKFQLEILSSRVAKLEEELMNLKNK